jgi:hypothetical protein
VEPRAVPEQEADEFTTSRAGMQRFVEYVEQNAEITVHIEQGSLEDRTLISFDLVLYVDSERLQRDSGELKRFKNGDDICVLECWIYWPPYEDHLEDRFEQSLLITHESARVLTGPPDCCVPLKIAMGQKKTWLRRKLHRPFQKEEPTQSRVSIKRSDLEKLERVPGSRYLKLAMQFDCPAALYSTDENHLSADRTSALASICRSATRGRLSLGQDRASDEKLPQ